GEVDASILAGRYFAARANPVLDDGRGRFRTLEGVVGTRSLTLTVGRGQVGFGAPVGGGIVLRGARFDRVQLATPSGFDAPGFLSPLGRVGFTTFLARIREDRHVTLPFFWGASLAIQPHWRTTFHVHRGAMVRTDG